MVVSKNLMTIREIEFYNRLNAASQETGVAFLDQAETRRAKFEIRTHQEKLPYPDEPRFDGCGHFVSKAFYQMLEALMAWIAAPQMLEAEYGIMSDQGFMRTFPTDHGSYRERWRADLDRFSVTLLKLAEPVLIWWHSSDDRWLFVQSRHAWGWVKSTQIAITQREQWYSWVMEREFLQSLDSRRIITYQAEGKEWQQLLLMGTKLPSYARTEDGYVVLLPRRNDEGSLRIEQIMLPADEHFCPGFLPMRPCRIVEQGLKSLGEPYGWGGADYFRDCTSLVDDIFGLFGFQLPRNSSAHRRMVGVQPIVAESESQREALIRSLPVGTVLYLPGHAMVFLGEDQHGELDILHSVYQMGLPMGDELVVYKARQVMRGHLGQYRANGSTFLQSLTEYWCPWQTK